MSIHSHTSCPVDAGARRSRTGARRSRAGAHVANPRRASGSTFWLSVAVLAATLTVPALAQTSADHELRIRIPNYVGIKIIDDSGNMTGAASVTFDYSADPTTYFAAAQGNGILYPTQVSSFTDVQVFKSGGTWAVYVRAGNLQGPPGGSGLLLQDIEVWPGSVSGLAAGAGNVSASWQLTTNNHRIAHGQGSTGGWQSLGFNGHDYVVQVQGNEDPGSYSTRVTYLLVNN